MWFKNLVLYRLSEPFALTPEQLSAALAAHGSRPCDGLEPFTYGWTPPLGRAASDLVHAANGCILLCARKRERILPPAVVRETVEDRVAEIEARDGRKVYAKERRSLRDQVIFELLPRAFVRSADTHAFLAPHDGWLVIDAASVNRGEDLSTLLRHSLATLAVEPFDSPVSPSSLMTRWLESGTPPKGFTLQHDCELRDPADEGGVIRVQRQYLESEEIRTHLRARKQVRRLALGFEERLSFVLCADLTIKRLRFDAVRELDDLDEADEATRLDANFAFMTAELKPFLTRLKEIFTAE